MNVSATAYKGDREEQKREFPLGRQDWGGLSKEMIVKLTLKESVMGKTMKEYVRRSKSCSKKPENGQDPLLAVFREQTGGRC